MQDWNGAVKKFLEQWSNRNDFEGAILSGSYAVGLQNKHSDIDIMIVLSDKIQTWRKGSLDIDGYLIEYIEDPAYFWEKAFKDDYHAGRKVAINMFAIGRILHDKNGIVKKLKDQAEILMQKPFKKMDNRTMEMAKYHIYWGVDELDSLEDEGFARYAPIYYLQLSNILNYYGNFTGISLPAPAKIYTFLNESEFRKKYKLKGFGDTEFVQMTNDCFENYSSLESIKQLSNYVLDKIGGFEPNGWVLRTDIKK